MKRFFATPFCENYLDSSLKNRKLKEKKQRTIKTKWRYKGVLEQILARSNANYETLYVTPDV